MKIIDEIRNDDLLNADGTISICRTENDEIVIQRFANRGKVKNIISKYEYITKDGNSELRQLNLSTANKILDRLSDGKSYSSSFILHDENALLDLNLEITEMEHKYTSTGIKFWRHQEQMFAFKEGRPDTVISTHISPEGACNLKCPYCSVTYRDTHSHIELDVIKDYVEKLITRGLKAVIFTGGGEPTAYRHFDKIVQWIKYEKGLSVALITNGTLLDRLQDRTLAAFSWLRVSINIFKGWQEKINVPVDKVSDDCVIGASMVFTAEHQATEEISGNRVEILKKAAQIADKINAKYIRILPNCLLEQRELLLQHRALDKVLHKLDDKRFFHQHKVHGTPKAHQCHQAYFRPYLSEEIYTKTGKAGTVYPCDSLVLNEGFQHFAKEYQICHASEVLDFLDKRIKMSFDPRQKCKGCVFTANVEMLDDWKHKGTEHFAESSTPLTHEEFV